MTYVSKSRLFDKVSIRIAILVEEPWSEAFRESVADVKTKDNSQPEQRTKPSENDQQKPHSSRHRMIRSHGTKSRGPASRSCELFMKLPGKPPMCDRIASDANTTWFQNVKCFRTWSHDLFMPCLITLSQQTICERIGALILSLPDIIKHSCSENSRKIIYSGPSKLLTDEARGGGIEILKEPLLGLREIMRLQVDIHRPVLFPDYSLYCSATRDNGMQIDDIMKCVSESSRHS